MPYHCLAYHGTQAPVCLLACLASLFSSVVSCPGPRHRQAQLLSPPVRRSKNPAGLACLPSMFVLLPCSNPLLSIRSSQLQPQPQPPLPPSYTPHACAGELHLPPTFGVASLACALLLVGFRGPQPRICRPLIWPPQATSVRTIFVCSKTPFFNFCLVNNFALLFCTLACLG
ncbi:hypothetical protein B0I35DRAFT_264290 [Stachybotrys elegans]|uniref:Uncharacterized protein n=1 Tax=Stachybotrys elegans TaxID=80388 RepID=A0A8K0SR67_9HYPO|nr:hypothetical protein B0I35DRAFT_264290 [Stachybotrys elegans]